MHKNYNKKEKYTYCVKKECQQLFVKFYKLHIISPSINLTNFLNNNVNQLIASVTLAAEIFWIWSNHLNELWNIR